MAPLCQVSPNYHLPPIVLLPPQEYIPPPCPFATPLHSHHCITPYTHYLPLYTSPAPQLYSSLPCSLPSHFRIFVPFMVLPLLPEHSPSLPIMFQCYLIHPNLWMTHPYPLPLPAPLPHFRFFFASFMPIFLLPASSPILPHCMTLFHYAPHSLDDPFDICFDCIS